MKDEEYLSKEDFDDGPIQTLNDLYEDYISDVESRNLENVDHYKQLCQHEQEIIANTKNPQNLQELAEYRETVLNEIDLTVPPYFNPYATDTRQLSAHRTGRSDLGPRIIEPYSELGDYLDKDDFSQLLSVLGSFAGKSASGLLSVGESILNQFVFKSKNEPAEKSDDEDEDYIVPGQQPQNNEGRASLQKVFSNTLGIGARNQQHEHSMDARSYVKDQAQAATNKISYIGRSVWGLLGGGTAQGM